MINASLYTLFTRGRYCRTARPGSADDRSGDSEQAGRAREERERFAAAAICFCCRHDPEFRKHFLTRICGIDNWSNLNVQVEPRRWSDLLISGSAGDRKLLHVIECKIEAALRPHQNPNEDAFWEKGGYGHSMRQEHSSDGTELGYTVLGLSERLSLPAQKNSINLSQVFWSDLEQGLPSSGLAQDLADTLGRLGCADFNMRTIRRIRVGVGFSDALKARLIFASVCKKLQIQSRWYWEDDGNLDGENAFLGCWIRSPSHPKSLLIRAAPFLRGSLSWANAICGSLHHVANRDEEWIVWFGYEAGPDVEGGLVRSVWLLCEDESRVNAICQAFPENVGTCRQMPDDERAAVITSPLKSKVGDFDWFVNALTAASELKV